ncbi:XdhC family protein [Pseudoxanthomonas beigongshangi]
MSSQRKVLEAAVRALATGDAGAALAMVVDTEGSTYVHAGAMALFSARDGQVGWLSGGCLEPDIERRALAAAAQGALDWMDIDTRDDEDLLSGSAVGCRGRLHLALLPLAALDGLARLLAAWQQGGEALRLSFAAGGMVRAQHGAAAMQWRLPLAAGGEAPRQDEYALLIRAAPRVLIFGAGPETPLLVPWLRELGWRVTVAERRTRWQPAAALADQAWALSPTEAATRAAGHDAALVMHHHFELDREALAALAETDLPFIGLLGPGRRRDDLFKVLPANAREQLRHRLRSPVGLRLGGQGPEAIALSIAAQLQAVLAGEPA